MGTLFGISVPHMLSLIPGNYGCGCEYVSYSQCCICLVSSSLNICGYYCEHVSYSQCCRFVVSNSWNKLNTYMESTVSAFTTVSVACLLSLIPGRYIDATVSMVATVSVAYLFF